MMSLALSAPPSALAADELERVFVGTPTQLTLPPDFRDEPPSDHGASVEQCKAPTEQDTSERLDEACSSGTSASRSPDDASSPEAKSLESALAKSGTDTGKPVP
jgi:hypothetical protein